MYFFNINACLKCFTAIGGNPEKGYTKGQLVLYVYSTLLSSSLIFLALMLVVLNNGALATLDVPKAFSTCFVSSHALLKSSTLFVKKHAIKDLLRRMNQKFWKLDDIDDPEEKLQHSTSYKSIKTQFYVFIALVSGGCLPRIISALLLGDEYQLFECYKPRWLTVKMLSLYQSITLMHSLVIPIFSFDMFILSVIWLTRVQFQMLNKEIRRLFDEKTAQHSRLRKCVEHHAFLLDYGERLNSTFSTPILFYIVIIVLSMCFEMYLATVLKSPAFFIQTLVYVFAATYMFCICYCLPAQSLSDEADDTILSAYFSNWYDYPEKAKALILIIRRGQKRMMLTAGGFMKIDLETCLQTVKTMVSYSMFLRTMGTQ